MTAAIYEVWEARFADLGYRPSNARICPLVTAGKRCRSGLGGEKCICQRHSEVLDHARVWLDKDGKHVYTAEPYEADGDELATLLADLHREGLRARFSGRSPWNLGSTFLIEITS
jgi:hypothetical protein